MLRLDAIHSKRLTLLLCLMLALLTFGGCRRSPEAKKAKFMESGKAFMKAKDYSRAILQFRNAAVYAGKDPEPYYQLGLAYLDDGQGANGLGAINEALKLNPKYTPAQLKIAELKALLGNRDAVRDAQGTLQKILSASPNDADALSTLALAEIKLGDEQVAIKNLESALQKSPENLRAAVMMAKIKTARGDTKGAEEVLQAAVKQAPKSADALVALASFYATYSKWPEAEHNLDQALQFDPKNDAALLTLGAVYMRTGQKDKAEQIYARLSALPPSRYKPMHAQFLFQEGKRDAAIAEFAKLAQDHPEDRVARTRLVTAYWTSNRKPEAEKVLTDALKHNPKDVDALLQRAEMELVTSRYTDARTDVEQALQYRPDSAPAHYIRANIYRVLGETALERQELSEALRIDKTMLAARLAMAQSMLRQNDGKSALAVLDSKEISDREKASFPVFVLRNYALIETGDYDTARKYVSLALARMKTPDLLFQDAILKTNKKDYAGAQASLEEALKMAPEDLRALDLLGKTYAAQKQLALGTQKIREYVASQPRSARLQKYLGDWLAATGDHNGALAAYTAAKQLNPDFIAADMAMVRIDIADNRNDDARQILTRLVANNSTNAEAFLWLGTIEERAGNFDGAMSDYRKVLNLDSNSALAMNNLAFLLAEHGRGEQLDEALKLAQQVRALAPRNGSVGDTMGWVYYKKGLYQSAVDQLKDAVSQDAVPSALHHYHLAMAYLMAGDHKHGNDELNEARKLNPNLPEARQAMALLQTKTAAN